ncbi:hypothetical protein NL676_013009 [Syzygium grande]|nr:hypothetical protein NL676_013009 [Syzygium grande]
MYFKSLHIFIYEIGINKVEQIQTSQNRALDVVDMSLLHIAEGPSFKMKGVMPPQLSLRFLSFEASLNYSFYKNGSSGIFGLFLCRGDVSSSSCSSCIENATQTLPNRCLSNQEAIIWYNECILHYLDADFFGVMVTYPRVFMWNVQNNTSPNKPNVNASALIYNLVANVPYTTTMYGVLESDRGDGSQQRYGLVQCSRDINSTQCSTCLAQLTEDIK